MKNEHTKKMILPIIIALVVGLYFLAMTVFLVIMDQWWSLLLSIIPLGLLAVLIAVTIQRIKEIKGGQEDDLSKY